MTSLRKMNTWNLPRCLAAWMALGSLLLVLAGAPPVRADNPPLACPCCGCFDLSSFTASAGGTSLQRDHVTKVQPDGEGQIPLSFTLPTTPNASCTDCSLVSLGATLIDANGKAETVTGSTTLKMREWTSPVRLLIGCGKGSSSRAVCLTYEFTWKDCPSCSTGCASSDATAGGAPDVKGGTGGSGTSGVESPIWFQIPVGNAGFGQRSAALEVRLDTPGVNPGPSALKLLGWSGITSTSSGGALTSVTVDSGKAVITSTPVAGVDPNAYTIQLSYDSASPSTTVFRTITVEKVASGQLKLTSFFGGSSRIMTWGKSGSTWTFIDSDLYQKQLTETVSGASRIQHCEEFECRMDTGVYQKISDTITEFQQYGGTWKPIKQQIDPTGANLVTTWTYFAIGEMTGAGSYVGTAELKDLQRYDGYFEHHSYWESGGVRSHQVQKPYATGTVTETQAWNSSTKTLGMQRSVGGNTLASSSWTYSTNTVTQRAYFEASNYLQTVTAYYPAGTSGLGGRLKQVSRPDGTITTYGYAVVADGSGHNNFVTTADVGGASGSTVVEGTRTVTTSNRFGNTIGEKQTAIGTGAGEVLSEWLETDIDLYGRPLEYTWFPMTTSWTIQRTYSCCGVATETDREGIVTHYMYDALHRRIGTHRLGVTTATEYNGLAEAQYRYAEATPFSTSPGNEISRTVRNLAGTVIDSYGVSPQTGGVVRLSTDTLTYRNEWAPVPNPGGLDAGIGLKTTRDVIQVGNDVAGPLAIAFVPMHYSLSYFDGQPYRSWGDLATAVEHQYPVAVYSTGHRTYSIDGIGADGTGGTLCDGRLTYTDGAGRTKTVTIGTASTTSYAYNSLGQLDKVTDADGVVTRYAYNSKGERTTTARKRGLAVSSITYGTDEVTLQESYPRMLGAREVMLNWTKVWKDGDTSPTGGIWTVASDSTPDGEISWRYFPSSPQAEITMVNHGTVDGDWNVRTLKRDLSEVVVYYIDGLWDSTVEYAIGGSTVLHKIEARKGDGSRGYDAFNRLTHLKDSRTGVTITEYVSDLCDEVKSVTPPGGVNRKIDYEYDHRGRRTRVDQPQSQDSIGNWLNNITDTEYYADGRVRSILSGPQSYPVTYTYDYSGRMKTLISGPSAAVTTWNYDPSTGWLLSKRDAANSGPDYTYTTAGRLLTRTWARDITGSPGTRVVTTYGYGYGRLVSVSYNDGTPAVTYNYNAFPADANHAPGMLDTVTCNGVTWTYKYDGATLNLTSESHPVGGIAIERILSRQYDTTGYGRPTGFQLGTAADADLDHKVTLNYDGGGRLYTVASFGQSYVYDYTVNSGNLLATITGPVHTVTNTWETDRNVLASKENKVGSVTRSKYSYTVNDLGQRIVQTTAGDAFGSTNRGWTWGYNYFGEVVKATHAASFTLNRAYAFDNIGNRISATEAGGTTNYTANALNQYASINVGTMLSPVYDLDGNLLEDKGVNGIGVALKYTWDAENRLIAVRRASDGASIASYTYDPFDRRIRKTTTAIAVQGASDIAYLYDGWNVVAEYTITSGPAIALNQGYIWGLDLSRTAQGAGGVGGLLGVLRTPSLDGSGNRIWGTFYHPTYDGNGNVSEYLNSSGPVADHHEYDPFGKLTTAPVTNIAYRFSSKPYDPETGLYYYGRRYYDAITGRWPSRDPIEENGGVNLYAFVENSSVNYIDYLGLDCGAVLEIYRAAEEKENEEKKQRELREDREHNLAIRAVMDIDCCTAEKVKKGKDELVEQYEKVRKTLRETGVNKSKYGYLTYVLDGDASCWNQNQNVILSLIVPPCWECKMENGKRPYAGDHWWVTCTAYTKNSGKQEIIFDAYYDRVGAQDPSVARNVYSVPIPVSDEDFNKTFTSHRVANPTASQRDARSSDPEGIIKK